MGKILRIAGPVVIAEEIENAKMYDVVRVGELGLLGEIIGMEGGKATIQVYEDTSGIRPGEKVESTGKPLSVVLAPGLLSSIYDGVQRPLDVIRAQGGDFIQRGIYPAPVDMKKKWKFTPSVKRGDKVSPGDIVGIVKETSLIDHRIMVPEGMEGTIDKIEEGEFTPLQTIGTVVTRSGIKEIPLGQEWPVRQPRPVKSKLPPEIPLVTGQRVIDSFFPVAKGGTVAVPGPFGSGKTVVQHQLAKWADSEVVVYIGCGERGNEMTEILTTFPELVDPKTGKPIMERTVLIANTSNMPVAAREASIYTGVTIGEYFRDMGYNVAIMADSTSRWAEALREISGRLEEMPGEEGYPAYLGRRIAEFYERAGNSVVLSSDNRNGSVTIIGAVSPPGGDTSEPVSQNTLRVTRVFWALDASLAQRRHFPSVNWLNSYSLYAQELSKWFNKNVSEDWYSSYQKSMTILEKEAELQEVAQLVGYDALPENEKEVLDIAKSLREDFLQQSAFDEVDTYCSLKKQYLMLKSILATDEIEKYAVSKGVTVSELDTLPFKEKLSRFKEVKESDIDKYYGDLIKDMETEARGRADKQ
ncbi:MAG: V-type ATP synthase subunit A [Candidatus Thermoplasmatota archaeon]|jgi:V/A-type H+-transporting ATPase subunit A|nr:V-type ATP synthase subunit A [Candidatus Thermoplasmatota archaeon]MCL6002369.1 V-type ATP synthase subunit A [Candidatus Thermoplasmatota archaeon]